MIKKKWIGMLSVGLMVWTVISSGAMAKNDTLISKPGSYSGYCEPIYDGWNRVSHYVPVQVGTPNEARLAVDFIFPTRNGKLFYELKDSNNRNATLPVVWTHTIYQRAFRFPDGSIYDWLSFQPWVRELLRYGYVIAVVDVRGTGASFGFQYGPFNPLETKVEHDVVESATPRFLCQIDRGTQGPGANKNPARTLAGPGRGKQPALAGLQDRAGLDHRIFG